MSIVVRDALQTDIPWLQGELKKFSEFFGTRKPLYNDEFAPHGLSHLIETQYFRVAEKEGVGPIGFISGVLEPHAFNPKITQLTEIFWWVSEDHRLSRAGHMLYLDFISFGKAKADWINFTLETASPVSEDFLTRQGFRLQERSFLLEVN